MDYGGLLLDLGTVQRINTTYKMMKQNNIQNDEKYSHNMTFGTEYKFPFS